MYKENQKVFSHIESEESNGHTLLKVYYYNGNKVGRVVREFRIINIGERLIDGTVIALVNKTMGWTETFVDPLDKEELWNEQ